MSTGEGFYITLIEVKRDVAHSWKPMSTHCYRDAPPPTPWEGIVDVISHIIVLFIRSSRKLIPRVQLTYSSKTLNGNKNTHSLTNE